MNVLMYCASSVSGGAVSYLRNLVPLLGREFSASAGEHRLQLLAHEDQKDLLDATRDTQVTLLEGARRRGFRRVIWERRSVARFVSERAIDVVFNPYQVRLRGRGVRHIMMLRNMEPFLHEQYDYGTTSRLRNRLLRRESALCVHSAQRVIVVSDAVRQLVVGGLGYEGVNTRLIHHGRDVAFSPLGDREDDSRRIRAMGVCGEFILTCGSLLPYRRCEDVVAAFSACAANLEGGPHLIIAGTGTDERYRRTIQDAISSSAHRDRIHLVGHVSKTDMIALYRRCSACVLATEIEACPNIAIEALSSGCAIVFANCKPLPEIIGGAGLPYQPRRTGELADLLIAVLGKDETRACLQAKARKRATHFSWTHCASATYSALVDW